MEPLITEESATRTRALIFLMVLIILFQGVFSFFVVKDRGQPAWDFRPLKDVPGQSPYAIYQKLPYPQHVKGTGGE